MIFLVIDLANPIRKKSEINMDREERGEERREKYVFIWKLYSVYIDKALELAKATIL